MIADLVEAQLAPFIETAGARIAMAGPDLQLKPDVVHGVSLALYELATNAAKYGALSVPDGQVAIDWELDAPAAGERRFRMSWRESGGPAVREPDRKGFGHIVINQMVATALRGEVGLDFAPDGVTWTLDAPAAAVLSPDQP
jgi:two-component sensor histidine kinase